MSHEQDFESLNNNEVRLLHARPAPSRLHHYLSDIYFPLLTFVLPRLLQPFVFPGHPTAFSLMFFVCISCTSLLFHQLATSLMEQVREEDSDENLKIHSEIMLQNFASAVVLKRHGGLFLKHWRMLVKFCHALLQISHIFVFRKWSKFRVFFWNSDAPHQNQRDSLPSTGLSTFKDTLTFHQHEDLYLLLHWLPREAKSTERL
jgi:hypothetical protein